MESARKEAWEEAGIEGDIDQEPLGSYTYSKWGAECTVTVYPMNVTKLVDEGSWEEQHRGRRWVDPEEAESLLKQKQLAPLVMKLANQLSGE